MQEPARFQVVSFNSDGTAVVLSRHALRDIAEGVAVLLHAEGYVQIRIEPEDEKFQRAA
jgi:hypothetical protein